jgi:hypothetical protein
MPRFDSTSSWPLMMAASRMLAGDGFGGVLTGEDYIATVESRFHRSFNLPKHSSMNKKEQIIKLCNTLVPKRPSYAQVAGEIHPLHGALTAPTGVQTIAG